MIRKIINHAFSILHKQYFFEPGIITNKKTSNSFIINRLDEVTSQPLVYIIYRNNGGSGFFSNVLHVYRHLQIANQLNLTPVVDFLNYPTIYSLDNPGHVDSWLNYFEPVSNYTYDEAYKSKNLILCNGYFPSEMPMSFDIGVKSSHDFFMNSIRVKKSLENEVDVLMNELGFESNRILGVHWRGGEQNRASGHWFGATKEQIFCSVESLLESNEYDKVFICTEQLEYFKLIKKRYGDLVLNTNYFRTNKNSYRRNVRAQHYYLLGKEILIDALLLSKCKGFIHANSNVSDFAAFLNNNKYKDRVFIDNGMNRPGKLSLIRYSYIKYLPSKMGGLKNNIIHYNNDFS